MARRRGEGAPLTPVAGAASLIDIGAPFPGDPSHVPAVALSPVPAWTLLDAPQREQLLRVIAVLAGVVIPLLVIGRSAAAILVPVIGGMLAAAIHWPRTAAPLQHALRRPLVAALATMFVLWLPSVAGSLKPGFSLAIWLQVIGLMLFVACLAAILSEAPGLHRWTLRVLVAMAVVGSAIAAISLLHWPKLLEYVRPVKLDSISNAPVAYLKSYAAVMPCLAPILLWAGWRLGGAWRGAAVAAVLLGAAVVHGAGNHAALGGYVGVALFVGAALALRRASKAARIAAALAGIAAAVAIAWLVLARLPPVPFEGPHTVKLPTWLVDAHRQAIWGFVFDRALERPWFGWGPSMANFVPGADDPVPGIGQTFVPLHAHNWVLQLLNDVGIVGLAAALAALAVFLLGLERRVRGGDGAALAALGLSGAFFVSTLANFSIWQGWWQSVFAVLLGIALGGRARGRGPAGARAEMQP
jgi:O-antigen ligase